MMFIKDIADLLAMTFLTPTAYCKHVRKAHVMEYRSTIVKEMKPGIKKQYHVNVCPYCLRVEYIEC